MKSICFVHSLCFVALFSYLNKLLAENLYSFSMLTKDVVYLPATTVSPSLSICFSSRLLVHHGAIPLISLCTGRFVCAAVSVQVRVILQEQNGGNIILLFLPRNLAKFKAHQVINVLYQPLTGAAVLLCKSLSCVYQQLLQSSQADYSYFVLWGSKKQPLPSQRYWMI